MEIRAFVNEFVERKCPVIPAILPSATTTPALPILLKHLHFVDFRVSIVDPLEQLVWGITGQKSKPQTLMDCGTSDAAALLPEKERQVIEIRLPGNLDTFSSQPKEMLLAGLISLLKIDGKITITESRSGSIRVFLELTPEEADKIYTAAKTGQLENLGITEARLYPSLADPPDEEQRSQLVILLNRVKEFWIDGVLKQSLHNEVLISLGKKPMGEAVDPPWNRTIELPKQRTHFSVSDTRIETVFDATGLLLILGEPGSGKTTTLLELVSILVARAETDPKERIPVVLNLSSWGHQRPLAEWIANKLNDVYSVPVKLARAWLDQGYLIPLLDGLDEVRTEEQADCVDAINTYITRTNPIGVVVCCRLAEYKWLPERLKMNGAICLEPLNQEQIDAYLCTAGSGLAALRVAIKGDVVLQELSQSPLMLGIMGMTYQSSRVESVVSGSTLEEGRKQVFDAYVEKMFEHRAPPDKAFTKDQTIYWLSWLAQRMTDYSQSVFFLETLQPSWLSEREHRLTYRAISSLMFGLVVGLVVGLIVELIVGSIVGLSAGLIGGLIVAVVYGLCIRSDSPLKNGVACGLIFGLISGLFGGLIFGQRFVDFGVIGMLIKGLIFGLLGGLGIGTLNNIRTIETVNWSWKMFLRKGRAGLAFGLAFALVYLLIGELSERMSVGRVFGLLFGLLFGLIGGLITGIIGGLTDEISANKISPNLGIKLSFKNGVVAGLVAGLSVGLIGGLIFSLDEGLTLRLTEESVILEVIVVLIVGLTAGLNRGVAAAIKHYALRFVLWRSGNTPFNFIKFLDYCAQIILLKKVGGGYIFIHRMLLEYFAGLNSTLSDQLLASDHVGKYNVVC